MMQATIPLESLMIPLMSLSNRDKRWIADQLYRDLKKSTAEEELSSAASCTDLPREVLMTVLQYAEQSAAIGDGVRNEDIENFVAEKLGWN